MGWLKPLPQLFGLDDEALMAKFTAIELNFKKIRSHVAPVTRITSIVTYSAANAAALTQTITFVKVPKNNILRNRLIIPLVNYVGSSAINSLSVDLQDVNGLSYISPFDLKPAPSGSNHKLFPGDDLFDTQADTQLYLRFDITGIFLSQLTAGAFVLYYWLEDLTFT